MKWWDRSRRHPVEHTPARRVPARHGRHGRTGRSALTKPPLPAVGSRFDRFDMIVTATVDFLRGAWPELREVRFDLSGMPLTGGDVDEVPRWRIDRAEKRIVLYRIPIERLDRAHGVPMQRADEYHRRAIVESAILRAAAEYLGRDPWDLGLDSYHDE